MGSPLPQTTPDEAVTALQDARQLVETPALLGGLPGSGRLDELVSGRRSSPARCAAATAQCTWEGTCSGNSIVLFVPPHVLQCFDSQLIASQPAQDIAHELRLLFGGQSPGISLGT